MSRRTHIEWLEELFQWYDGQGKELRARLDSGREVYSEGHENEWLRYREEAAAIRAGIEALTLVSDPQHSSDCALHNAPALPVEPCNCWLARLSVPTDPQRT